MPARKKSNTSRQDNRPQRQARALALVGPQSKLEGEKEIPPLPSFGVKTHPDTKSMWERYWTSMPAEAAIEVDIILAERWIISYDEWRKSMNAVRKKRTVPGSQGQPVMNPLAAWAKAQADEMRKCEASLGIGPKERAGLGIDFGRAQLTAAELNRMTEEDDGYEDAIEVEGEEAELLAEFDEG